MPNPNTISWLHYEDIQIPDVETRNEFRNYMSTGNFNQAMIMLASLPAYKAFIADTLNSIATGALTLENLYFVNGPEYLEQLTDNYTTLVNNLRNMGDWLATVQYNVFNFVYYNNNVYFCIDTPPMGTNPTNETYWLYLGLQGIQGVGGIDVVMQFEWNQTITYTTNDLVTYNGQIYVALRENTGVRPGNAPDDWMKFIDINLGGINVGTNPPVNPQNNYIWLQTESDPLVATTTDPISCQFYRYVENASTWEEMYPNTIFKLINGTSDYIAPIILLNVTILSSEWSANSFTYANNNITDNSQIYILPGESMSNDQYDAYNTISITINVGQIVFSRSESFTVDLPIRIIIQ